jgi:hypothetical protein
LLNIRLINGSELLALLCKPQSECREVLPVTFQRIFGEAIFQPKVIDKAIQAGIISGGNKRIIPTG